MGAPAAGIERIEPDGIVTSDSRKSVIDILVLATGFDLWGANFPAIEVGGREGHNLGKWWRANRIETHRGVSAHTSPTSSAWASPYAFAFAGFSFFNTMEYQMHHMNRLFGELRRHVNRPGMSGDSTSWEGWSHVSEFVEEVPAGAAGAGGADGRRDPRPA